MSGATWTRITTPAGPRWQSAGAVREDVPAAMHPAGSRATVKSAGAVSRWTSDGDEWVTGSEDGVESFEAADYLEGTEIQTTLAAATPAPPPPVAKPAPAPAKPAPTRPTPKPIHAAFDE